MCCVGGQLLRDIRPVIYCEVASSTRDAITTLLHGYAYKLWDGRGFSGTNAPGINQCANNTVTIPEEKSDDYADQNV